MALEEQMEMSFGEIPDNTVGVDPVSGNEIPLGSSAKEVRDDIPAQLSEGEMVIPADVVRFFGVKFFEDIRQAAKIGYAKMDEDGRIGGEPIPMEDESGLGLEMADLEVMDTEGEPEEAFLGKFFAGIRESNRKQAEKNKQSVRDRFQAAKDRGSSSKQISKRVQANKDKPKNRYEQIREQMSSAFRNDDDNRSRNRRVTLDRKPPTSDDASGPSLAEQINFGGDFSGNKKTKKASPTSEAGKVEEAYTGENLRSDKSFGQRFMEGLGYDEGGMAAQELSLPTPVEDPDVVQEGTTGGFGEEIGLDQGVFGGEMEAREYQNAAGHKIIIMFLDGEPMQEIPVGYYPVGSEPVTIDPGEQTGGGGGSDDDDGPTAPTPTPIDYQSLSLAELKDMVADQKNIKHNAIAAGMGIVNPILGLAVKAALWNQTRLTKKEIERRLESDTTSNVDKMRYENLLDITNREEPGLAAALLGKITGDYTGPELKSPKVVEGDVSDPTMAPDQGIAKAYTPETTTPETTTGFSPELMEQINKIGVEAAEKAFSGYKAPVTEKDDDDDDDKGPTFVSTPATTQVALDNQSAADAAMGRPTSSSNDDDGPSLAEEMSKAAQDRQKQANKFTESKIADYRSGKNVSGFDEGGLMKSKKKKATKKKK
jgi:hypothetical protein